MLILRRLCDRLAAHREVRLAAQHGVTLHRGRTLALTEVGAGPSIVWFDAEADAPYRLRRLLRRPNTVAATTLPATAARLRLLTRRVVCEGDRKVAVARAIEWAVLGARPEADAAPVGEVAPNAHIVLQVGDFTEGGMEQVVIDLADALAHAGMRVTIAVLGRTGPAAARATARGLTLRTLEKTERAYAEFLASEQVALVNAHFSTFGAELCAREGIPFVQTIHNMYMWFGAAERAEYRAADRATRAYVCVSNNVARYADVALGLGAERMLVIPNGCDRAYVQPHRTAEQVAAARRELGVPPTAPFFLNVASIQPAKAQHMLLAAFADVAADCPEAHLVFLGQAMDTKYGEALIERTRAQGLADRVHWAGHRSDVSTAHAAAAALVMPSFFEGWSLAITEAVLAGLPVIATDVGGASEQLEGTDGILLPAAASDLTAIDIERLLPLLEAPCATLRQSLGAALRTIYARGNQRSPMPPGWELMLRECAYERYARVFRCLLGGGSPDDARAFTEPVARPLATETTAGSRADAVQA